MKQQSSQHSTRKATVIRALQRLDGHINTNPTTSTTAPLVAFPKISKSWIITWIVIYLIILILGVVTPLSPVLTMVKIGGVLLCSIYSLAMFPKDYFLQAAMLTTFVADCMLAYDNLSNIGLTIFFLAQCIHLYRLQTPERRQFIITLTMSGIFIIIVNAFVQLAPSTFLIAGLYAIVLTCNFYTSAKWYRANPKLFPAACAFAGFALFACCDLCIVTSFLSLTGVFVSWLYAPANFLGWFFYYPSQILVSNSTKCVTIDAKEG